VSKCHPGVTTLARMFSAVSSIAACRVRPMTPALVSSTSPVAMRATMPTTGESRSRACLPAIAGGTLVRQIHAMSLIYDGQLDKHLRSILLTMKLKIQTENHIVSMPVGLARRLKRWMNQCRSIG
jgi:hypothetical protein